MKKVYLAILASVGINTEALAASADESVVMNAEHLAAIQTAVSQNAQLALDVAAAENARVALANELAAVTARETETARAHAAALAALNERIATLGAAPGGTVTQLPGTDAPKGEAGAFQGMPAYVNTEQPIYKLLASMG